MFGISVLFKSIATDLGLRQGTATLAVGIGRLEGNLFLNMGNFPLYVQQNLAT